MRIRLLAFASALALVPAFAAVPALAQSTTGNPPSTPQRFAPGGSAGEGNITPSGDMTWHPPGVGAYGTEAAADTAPGSAGGTAVGPTGILTAPGANTTAREFAQNDTKSAPGSAAGMGQPGSGSNQSSSDQSKPGQSGSSQSSTSQGSSDQSSSGQGGSSQSSASQGSSDQSGSSQSSSSQGQSGQQQAAAQQIEQQTNQRINTLKQRLQITQAEEPKWQAFADAMKKNAQELAQFWQKNGPRTRQMNAVEGLQFYTQMTLLYAQGAERLVQPFQALYQEMPKQQQEVADRVFQQVRAQAAARRRGNQSQSQQGSGAKPPG